MVEIQIHVAQIAELYLSNSSTGELVLDKDLMMAGTLGPGLLEQQKRKVT